MVNFEDMTREEQDRFVQMILSPEEIEAATRVYLHSKKDASTEDILRFCFKIARKKFIPKHLQDKKQNKKGKEKKYNNE